MTRRRVRTARCPSCRRTVLEGLSGDVAAWQAVVDPEPLGPAGEAVALLLGLHTYRLRLERLDIRDPWHISDRDPILPGDVVADHDCRLSASLDPLRIAPRPKASARYTEPAECPY